jgi:serine/threonine protein kinase
LTDFELVEPLSTGNESAITRVMESRIKVDPGFSSAELIMHPVTCDQRSDLFGAGACLYFMLTRRAPFPGQLPAGDMSRLFNRRYTAPRKLNENIPSAVSGLLSTALAPHAEDRYREPADMKEQVDAVLDEM